MDLNERIAAWMGWKHPPRDDEHLHVAWIMPDGRKSYNPNLPAYTTDHNAARLVLAEVERRGLQAKVIEQMFKGNDFWAVLTATPAQICEAALAAGGSDESE